MAPQATTAHAKSAVDARMTSTTPPRGPWARHRALRTIDEVLHRTGARGGGGVVFSTVGLRFWAMLISAPPPRDVALPQEPTIVSWRRALASNVMMRHVRTVQQVY